MISWLGTGLEFTVAYAVIIMSALIVALVFNLKGAEKE